jgi:hypothetical protein
LIGTRSKRVPGHLKSCDRDALNGVIQIAGFSAVGIRPAHVAQFAKILTIRMLPETINSSLSTF